MFLFLVKLSYPVFVRFFRYVEICETLRDIFDFMRNYIAQAIKTKYFSLNEKKQVLRCFETMDRIFYDIMAIPVTSRRG